MILFYRSPETTFVSQKFLAFLQADRIPRFIPRSARRLSVNRSQYLSESKELISRENGGSCHGYPLPCDAPDQVLDIHLAVVLDRVVLSLLGVHTPLIGL